MKIYYLTYNIIVYIFKQRHANTVPEKHISQLVQVKIKWKSNFLVG